MTWPEFFSLRRKIQLVQRLAGIPFVVAFWVAEGFVLSLPIFDPTKTIFDLDPMVVVGLGSVVGSIASYFVGTAISSLAWRLLRPHQVRQLDLKQKDFYARVSKYRANVPPNPTQMNFNFDFYGEKVRSVSDYRSWLRRQRQLVADRRFAV
jgi:import inner membrane translocase subunit TIM23